MGTVTKKTLNEDNLFIDFDCCFDDGGCGAFRISCVDQTRVERAWKKQIQRWSWTCRTWLIDWKCRNYKSWDKSCWFRFENKSSSPSFPFPWKIEKEKSECYFLMIILSSKIKFKNQVSV